mmetsp:Transcript_41559/g.135604  ORF Transcript_41559/g.135604 Transcript_41559/m.135604 type:complete len:240 (+) Transcript_41559:2575-3294(+)
MPVHGAQRHSRGDRRRAVPGRSPARRDGGPVPPLCCGGRAGGCRLAGGGGAHRLELQPLRRGTAVGLVASTTHWPRPLATRFRARDARVGQRSETLPPLGRACLEWCVSWDSACAQSRESALAAAAPHAQGLLHSLDAAARQAVRAVRRAADRHGAVPRVRRHPLRDSLVPRGARAGPPAWRDALLTAREHVRGGLRHVLPPPRGARPADLLLGRAARGQGHPALLPLHLLGRARRGGP